MTDIIINLKDVCKSYLMGEVEVTALCDINLTIKKGEFVAIQGPSGSGKSTMLNAVSCLDTPTRGKIFLEHHNISDLSESDLASIRGRKIGFIFQVFNLVPSLDALENVMLPMVFQGIPLEIRKQRAEELLDLVGLKNRARHRPNQLSGGERQRVAIARSLANDPEVILADEPTGNLDSKTGKEIMELLIYLNKKKDKTVIMVTHDDKLASYADRIVRLKDGKIVSGG